LIAETDAQMALKDRKFGEKVMRGTEKQLYLLTLDHLWKEHLHALDELRRGIGLRSYGQKNPLSEYKHESFAMFQNMLTRLNDELTFRLAHVEPQPIEVDVLARKEAEVQKVAKRNIAEEPQQAAGRNAKPQAVDAANPETWGRVGRNEVCPCGSGKKFKQCHGKLA
jgi:preprotein translocase subunit SecA